MQTTKPRRERLSLPSSRRTSDAPSQPGSDTLDTRTLFKGRRELKIQHNSETYRLTITKLGKLILTK
ncbi:hemin uptake protein HemP [uncultured Roseibium sp.]|jgi:hemin uptake protein HemP|uniref:hemin uptake protein HemP n=1 Tax=uncultured Roseibium sp. TaxID=1936171 RepID=UPI003216BA82